MLFDNCILYFFGFDVNWLLIITCIISLFLGMRLIGIYTLGDKIFKSIEFNLTCLFNFLFLQHLFYLLQSLLLSLLPIEQLFDQFAK